MPGITKYASLEVSEILDLKGARTKQRNASLDKVADFENYRTGDGYLYARIRAISSRVNKNHDGWPSIELAGSREIFDHHHSMDRTAGFTVEAADGNKDYGFATFVGKPIFVDHHNSNPKKARGVIVDSKLRVLDSKTAADDQYWNSHEADHEHLPPTEVELLLEIDADSFPRLAQAIVSGDLDGFSMGCDVDYSKCSHCGHTASSPDEYCSHILMKGAHHDFKTADGKRVSRKSYENCYGIKFFEISAVFEPADETALAREIRSAVYKEADMAFNPDIGMGSQGDPMAPYHQQIADLAMQYQLKGVDGETAMDMARRQVMETSGLGGGEGYRTPHEMGDMPQHGQLPPWRGDSWPKGLTSPNLQFDNGNAMMGNDPYTSAFKHAENELPQEMHTRAPEELDTLRDERLCPICGNDMQGETCQVCGYVEPPKEFDNPDLDKAKQIRQEMKDAEEQQATQPQTATQPGSPQAGGGNPTGPAASPSGPSKAPATAKVTSDMHNWTPKVHPKVAARINQVERPVNASTTPSSNEPKNETVIKDQTRPVTAAMLTARELMANARNTGDAMRTRTADGPTPPGDTSPHKRVDVMGVGGVDEASNEEASHTNNQHGQTGPGTFKQVDVTGIGGTGVEGVDADKTESLPTAGEKSDDSGFNTDKTTEDSGPTKTWGDSDGGHSGVTDPVTSETPYWIDESKWSHERRAYEDGTLESLDQQAGGENGGLQNQSPSRGVEPVDSVGKAQDRVDLTEHKTSPDNNSGPTKTWSGTDGNGVLKQQDPVTKEDQEWGNVKVPDVKLHTSPVKSSGKISFAAVRLAEMEAELGLITREARFNRMIELDQQDPRQVTAQIETLSRVKTAGLAKLAAHRQGKTKLPFAFGKHTAAPNGFQRIAHGVEEVKRPAIDDESLDSGLFL